VESRLQPQSNDTSNGAILGELCDIDFGYAKRPAVRTWSFEQNGTGHHASITPSTRSDQRDYNDRIVCISISYSIDSSMSNIYADIAPTSLNAYEPVVLRQPAFVTRFTPHRHAGIAGSNNNRSQHGLSSRILYRTSIKLYSFDIWPSASPEIPNSAMPCTRLLTPLGRAELREVEADANDANNTDRPAEGFRASHSVRMSLVSSSCSHIFSSL
jgi:hypothetical protein